MKTIVFKGFVLASLFTLIGFVASAQHGKVDSLEIKPFKVEVQTIDCSSKTAAKKKNNQVNARSYKVINTQALPIEKREIIRKESLPKE